MRVEEGAIESMRLREELRVEEREVERERESLGLPIELGSGGLQVGLARQRRWQ